MDTREPSAFRIERALAAWREARDLQISAGNIDPDDPLARAETDIEDILTRLARYSRYCDRMVASCDAGLDEIEHAKAKWLNRKDASRHVLFQLMELLDRRQHQCGDVQVGYRRGTPRVILTKPEEVPAEYKRTETREVVDMRAIGKAMAEDGLVFDWAELSNAPDVLWIRGV